MGKYDLRLYEEALLLSLKDKEGTIEFGAFYAQAIAGGILSDLILEKRIKITEHGKKKKVEQISLKRIGDEMLDECLQKIGESKKELDALAWITKFSGIKDLKNRIARMLCRKGILKEDEDKVMLIFTRKIFPEVDPEPERKIIERLREAIFTDSTELDARTIIITAIAQHGGLLKNFFDKKELKAKKSRIEDIIKGNVAAEAAKESIEAIQAAMLMVAVMPALMTTTVTSS